jgi:peptide/nickel transport system substrate-binding protein
MDWKRFDAFRRNSGPIELDLIESYAQKKIKRRDFIRRGTIVGLSMPFMASIIAACGSDDDESTETESTEGDGDGGGGGGSAAENAGGTASTGTKGGNLIVAVQEGDANSGLDPVNMLDLGTYNVLSQSFEYLVGVGDDGNIAPTALATGWEPSADGSQWTFDLRTDATWVSGETLTSTDVAATMDRLVAQGNAGLAGVIEEGSVDDSDPAKAVITLVEPNGNFPVLVSLFNAQALITPADYTDGTTLDSRPEGTGAWLLDDWDPTTFVAKYTPNSNWWGGEVNLDSIELRGFTDIATAVTAMSAREVDVIQQFSVIGGEGLLADDTFTLLTPPSANHRQVWFHTENGQFTDKLIRQAMGYTLDRDQMVTTLFSGRAEVANDHPVLSSLPFYDADAVPQRTRDIEKAKSLLAEAGVESITANIECGNLQEIPDLAAIIQQNAKEAGFELSVQVQDNSTFYGDSWCPGGPDDRPCGDADEFGIVDYGHRPVPDIYFSSALATGGVWNSSNYASEEFDQQLSNYRTSVDVDGQKTAIGEIQKILHEDTPACYPYFFNFLSGHDSSVSGVQSTALGHTITSSASKDA